MTTAPASPTRGIEVGAVGVSRAEGTAQVLAVLGTRLGLGPRALALAHSCPGCGATDHGAPALRRAGDGTTPGGAPGDDGERVLPAVSLTHVDGPRPVTVLAWCTPSVAGTAWGIGVDAEDPTAPQTLRAFAAGADGAAEIDAVAFAAEERAALAGLSPEGALAERVRLWTVKEALVKARGTGLDRDPAEVRPQPEEAVVPLADPRLPPGVVGTVAWRQAS